MLTNYLTNSTAYRTQKFNITFKSAVQKSLSGAESTQSLVLIPIYLTSILIMSSDLRLGLPKGLFPVGLTT